MYKISGDEKEAYVKAALRARTFCPVSGAREIINMAKRDIDETENGEEIYTVDDYE